MRGGPPGGPARRPSNGKSSGPAAPPRMRMSREAPGPRVNNRLSGTLPEFEMYTTNESKTLKVATLNFNNVKCQQILFYIIRLFEGRNAESSQPRSTSLCN